MGGRWPLRLDFSNILSVPLNRQQARRTLLLEIMDVETHLLGDVEQWAYTKMSLSKGRGVIRDLEKGDTADNQVVVETRNLSWKTGVRGE